MTNITNVPFLICSIIGQRLGLNSTRNKSMLQGLFRYLHIIIVVVFFLPLSFFLKANIDPFIPEAAPNDN